MSYGSAVHPAGNTDGSESELSLVQIGSVLLRHRRQLLIFPILIGILGVVVALTEDRTYIASASFLAGESESSGLSAIAQRFGAEIDPNQGGKSPAFYASLLESREILRKTVESTFTVPTDDRGGIETNLVEFYGVVGSETVPAWKRATESLAKAISTSVNNSTGVVDVRVSAAHPRLAEAITERLLDLLSEFNLETRQSRARAEERFVAERLEEAHAGLAEAERAMTSFLTQNRYFRSSPELLFEHERLQRQIESRQELYIELARSRAQARIAAIRSTPVLTIIEPPAGSASVVRRGVATMALIGFILGFMLAVFVAFIVEFGKTSRRKHPSEYQEFERLRLEAAQDIRRLFGMRRRDRL